MAYNDWPEAKVDRLRLLWAQNMSCSAIAADLKLSKNAVVGKVHRLGLLSRESPIKKSKEPAITMVSTPAKIAARGQSPVRQPPEAWAIPVVKVEPVQADPRYRSNGSIPGGCKFPMWPHTAVKATGPFCNVRVRRADSPYCEQHRAICYQEV